MSLDLERLDFEQTYFASDRGKSVFDTTWGWVAILPSRTTVTYTQMVAHKILNVAYLCREM